MVLSDLVRQILLAIGVARTTQAIDAAQSTDVTNVLNVLVDSWNADGLMTVAPTSEYFTLTSGTSAYTWGTGGTLNSARPNKILRSFIRDSDVDYPVLLVGGDYYQSIPSKTDTGRPEYVWCNFAYPLAATKFYPEPDSAYVWYVDTEKDLIDFSDLSTTIALPGYYLEALKWNGALRTCPNYNKEPSQFLMKMAEDSKSVVERINAANNQEPVCLGIFTANAPGESKNILTGP